MEKTLCKLLCDFKVLSNKVHVLHTSMTGDEFLPYHPFLGEIYGFLEGQIDAIMEDMEQLGYLVPLSLDEILDETGIDELKSPLCDPEAQMKVVDADLKYMIVELQKGIILCGAKEDLVIQNNLIDHQKQLRLFQRKNRRMMGKK